MVEFKLNPDTIQDGVYFLSPINNEFESIYLKVREKENRIYSNDEVRMLPFASSKNPHRKEWELRTKSFNRFKEYLRDQNDRLNILDLGCGNGWFSGGLAKTFNYNFYCVDVNLTELKQGAKVFKSDKLKFIYADIFREEIPLSFFDLIVLNASVQYFPDLKRLLKKLFTLLNENGELHIIDSPFYSNEDVKSAKERTRNYYLSIGFPEMSERYFHHTFSELKDFNIKVMYKPDSPQRKIIRLLKPKDSPFPWIQINK